MYLSLARKYRPRTFAEVAVQTHVSNTLRGAIARGRVAHGYLLCGPRGVGKTTLARVLAMALNCEQRTADGEPCGVCDSCTRIWAGSASLDVIEIDAASNRGVDDARELRERAMYAPSGDQRYKVYIVDEAHMLTREAWNALLKILEEPPPRVVFVFATTEPQKIAQAAMPVMSRLQRFDFKRIGAADVRARLSTVLAAEQIAVEPEALRLLARAADGSMRDALSLADQALALGDGGLTAQRVRDALGLVPEDEVLAVLEMVAGQRAADVFPTIARLADAGVDLGLFLSAIAGALRSALEMALGGETAGELSETTRDALARCAGRFAPGDLVRMLTAITELEPRFRRSSQQQILLEMLLVRFALLDRTVSIEAMLRELGPGGKEGGSSSDRPPSAPDPRPAPGGKPGGPANGDRGAVSRDRPVGRVATPEPPLDQRPVAALPADAVPADVRQRTASPAPRDRVALDALVGQWPDVVARLRADGRMALSAALEHAQPVAVSAAGEITLELPPSGEIYQQPIATSAADVLVTVGTLFTGATRLAVHVAERGNDDQPTVRRFTEESVRLERLATLRRRDPVLDAAVDTLDLELLD